jgi:hypothetical protein
MAHTAGGALRFGIEDDKLAAVWDYQTSPLFSPAERAALDLTVTASCVPNAVTDDMFVEMRKYWSEDQIVEIVGCISVFGFLIGLGTLGIPGPGFIAPEFALYIVQRLREAPEGALRPALRAG